MLNECAQAAYVAVCSNIEVIRSGLKSLSSDFMGVHMHLVGVGEGGVPYVLPTSQPW